MFCVLHGILLHFKLIPEGVKDKGDNPLVELERAKVLISAASRLYLGCISTASRVYLGRRASFGRSLRAPLRTAALKYRKRELSVAKRRAADGSWPEDVANQEEEKKRRR